MDSESQKEIRLGYSKMLANNQLITYDSWDIHLPSIPIRSRLYQLEPIGIGTPYVESLTSFIIRLAEAHCLLPRTLINEIIAPQLQKVFVKRCTSRGLGALFEKAKTINSNGNIARDFIQALESLTFHENLQLLTLLSWSDVIVSKGLFRSHKAWCSACYQEWFTKDTIIYEPLIWSIKAVEICPKHNIYLSDTCHHCHEKLPLLTWHSRLRFCSKCHEPLIKPASANYIQEAYSQYEFEKLIWAADSLGKLVSLTPKLNSLPSRDIFITNLDLAVNIITEGNIANFASLLEIPKNTLWGWCKGKVFPSIDALLKMTWLLKIPLADFLTKEIEITKLQNISIKASISTPIKKRSSPRTFDYKQTEKILLEVLNQPLGVVPTIKSIAEGLGYNRRILSKHFPDLCRAIVVKRRNFEKINHQQNIQDCCQEVRQAAIYLYKQGQYPSEANISQMISRPGFFRYKQVRGALRSARKELGLES